MCSHVEGCRSGSFSKNFRSGGSAEFCIRTEVCVLRTKVRVLGSVLLSETNNQRRKKSPSHQSDGSVMRGGHCYRSWEQRGEEGGGREGGGGEGEAERGRQRGGEANLPAPLHDSPCSCSLVISSLYMRVRTSGGPSCTSTMTEDDLSKGSSVTKTWSWRTF